MDIYQRVHIQPYADLKSIDFVQVLTRRPQNSQTAGVVLP